MRSPCMNLFSFVASTFNSAIQSCEYNLSGKTYKAAFCKTKKLPYIFTIFVCADVPIKYKPMLLLHHTYLYDLS